MKHDRLSPEIIDDSCSICFACSTHSVERNGTRPMVGADRYGLSASVQDERGQMPVRSAKASLTRFGSVLRGTERPFELHSRQLHCETLPSALTSSSKRLTAVPRPGFAGSDARGIKESWRHQVSTVSKRMRSACGGLIPARSLRSLPPNKGKAPLGQGMPIL